MSGECGNIINPERALWQMVLHQAVHDALHGPRGDIKTRYAELWQEAREFIVTPSEDLAMVCAMAGVEMDAVIERMRHRMHIGELSSTAKLVIDGIR
jgi:hypothetical protein